MLLTIVLTDVVENIDLLASSPDVNPLVRSDSAAGGRRPSAPPALRRAVSGGVGVSGNLGFRVQGLGLRV